MKSQAMTVQGLGVTTDAYPDVNALADAVINQAPGLTTASPLREAIRRTQLADNAAINAHDALSQLALRAAHQALSMGAALTDSKKLADGDETALLFISSWGTIDSTVAYLDTMLESEGRYASPRHFARSVYSSAASITAIHFGIHGPCETLCFPESPIAAAVARAGRLLAAGRCRQVMAIWAEQASDLAADLARRAAVGLHRKELERYAQGPVGFGAVALLLNQQATGLMPMSEEFCQRVLADAAPIHLAGGPFAMDGAVQLAAAIIRGASSP